MIEQNTRPGVELGQLYGQGARRQVEADIGNGLKPVWKGALGDDRPQILGAVGPFPEVLSRSGIRGKGYRRSPLSNQQPHSRNNVIDGNWGDFNLPTTEAADGKRCSGRNFNETDRRVEVVGYSTEIGPGVVVEEVAFDVGQDPAGRIDRHRLIVKAENILNQEGQGRGVVTVCVGDDHMPNFALLVNFERPCDRPGIDGDGVINQKRRHSTRRIVTTKTAEDLKFHRTSITRKTNG